MSQMWKYGDALADFLEIMHVNYTRTEETYLYQLYQNLKLSIGDDSVILVGDF